MIENEETKPLEMSHFGPKPLNGRSEKQHSLSQREGRTQEMGRLNNVSAGEAD